VGVSPILRSSSSTFLRPFAPDPFQALRPSYGRSDSCPRRLGSAGIIVRRPPPRLLRGQVSLIHAPDLPTIPSPTTCVRSVSPRYVTCRRIEPRPLPYGSSPYGNSGLRHSLAGSPRHTGRLEFLSVRTGRSPPAAPHPVSPRRSCWLITSYVNSERTSTSRIVCALRRTSRGQRPRRIPPGGSDREGVESGWRRTCVSRLRLVRPLQGRDIKCCAFRGRCPRLLSCAPAGRDNLMTSPAASEALPFRFAFRPDVRGAYSRGTPRGTCSPGIRERQPAQSSTCKILPPWFPSRVYRT
jgi:hypothetical protein